MVLSPVRALRRGRAQVGGLVVEARRRRENVREQRARVEWPLAARAGAASGGPLRLTLVIANHNSKELIGQLIFGIHRVLDPSEVCRIVVVDNASTDGSVPLLEQLQEAGLVTLVRRHDRPYHGPGLNAGISFLAEHQDVPDFRTDLVVTMDSDVFALRPGGLTAAGQLMVEAGALLSGPARGELPPFYAHPSLLLMNPTQVWRGDVPVFHEHGAPGIAMQEHLRRQGELIVTFPFFRFRYFLHLGHGTVKNLDSRSHRSNRYHPWAATGLEHHYERDPQGQRLHELWAQAFSAEVSAPTAEALIEACGRTERVSVLGDLDPLSL